MQYTSTPNTKRCIIAVSALLFAALLFVGISLIFDGFAQRLTRISALIAFTAAILLIPVGMLYDYTYSEKNGEFTVVRHNKRARTVVCRIYTAEIAGVLTKKEARELYKKDSSLTVYNYCPTLLCKQYCCLLCENGDGKSIIKLECPHDFASYIKDIIKKDTPPEL